MVWYLKAIEQYADFSDRARRAEFWMFILFNIVFAIVAIMLDNLLGTTLECSGESLGYGWLFIIYFLTMIMPSMAVGVRRLHDIGKSGWNYLLILIPVVGWIILLVWWCMDSQAKENQWGENPKENY